MSIICQLCQTKFNKIIPWQHLRLHEIDSKNYKQKFGSLYSDDTLKLLRNKIPHNKGAKVTDPIQLAKLNAAIQNREQRFKAGEFSRGTKWTATQKQHLSNKSIEFAATNPNSMKLRARKAIETKIKNGYDIGSGMRGKNHSVETKIKISKKSILSNLKKSQNSNLEIIEKIKSLSLTLLNQITEKNLLLACNNCRTKFSFTKQYFHPSKFKESMCPTCYPRIKSYSQKEIDLYNYILAINPNAINGFRDSYHSKEIDIFIPDLKIGFEFNGLYWHSESVLLHNNQDPKKDYNKLIEMQNNGIRLIQIFEDEWDNKKNIVLSRIDNILGVTGNKIFARNCVVKEVSSRDASLFAEATHIMGRGRSNIRYGLYHNDKLISCMTFTNNNLSRKINSQWEINRFSSLPNTLVVGGASKLFAKFVKTINPTNVISYSDNRWSSGLLYQNLGFKLINPGKPNYWYTKHNTSLRIHRFRLRAKEKNKNEYVSESTQAMIGGFSKIWDSGAAKWQWSQN